MWADVRDFPHPFDTLQALDLFPQFGGRLATHHAEDCLGVCLLNSGQNVAQKIRESVTVRLPVQRTQKQQRIRFRGLRYWLQILRIHTVRDQPCCLSTPLPCCLLLFLADGDYAPAARETLFLKVRHFSSLHRHKKSLQQVRSVLGAASPHSGFHIVRHDNHGQVAYRVQVARIRCPFAVHEVERFLCC